MDPSPPINGISLERYAELAAEVDGIQDPAQQSQVVAQKGINPFDWESARSGWTARMQDPALGGQVVGRFTPLFEAALARKKAAASAALAPPAPAEPMNAVSGAMPGAVPVPGYGASPSHVPPAPAAYGGYAGAPAPGYGGAPVPAQPGPSGWPQPAHAQPGYPQPAPGHAQSGYPQPGYPQPGYPQPGYPQPGYAQPGYPQPGYPQQPNYNQQAAAIGSEVGNAFNAFGNALGSLVSSAVGGFVQGSGVMVLWSDGQRYPGTVMMAHSGQVQVAFADGRQVWVSQQYVTLR